MTIYDSHDDDSRHDANDKKHNAHRPKEQLSERELRELMGVKRDMYKRVNRRVRRR